MKRKKEQTVEYNDKMKRLERRYAKWKEKQRLEELLEMEEYFTDEFNSLDYDLERRW